MSPRLNKCQLLCFPGCRRWLIADFNTFTETSGREGFTLSSVWHLHGGKIPETAENLGDAAAGEN